MQRVLFWAAALLASAAMTGHAAAQGHCDALGLTIRAESNCVQMGGRVQFSMLRGTHACAPQVSDCGSGPSLDLSNGIMLSGLRLGLDGGATFTAPDPFGLLETGNPVTTPAYNTDVTYSGFKIGIGLDAQLHTDWFKPMDLGIDLGLGQLTGKGMGGAFTPPNGIGVPSVGLIDGAPVGNHTVNSTDILINRTFGTLDKSAKIPLFGGEHQFGMYETSYTGYGIVGSRFGLVRETQDIDIATTPGGTITYDTTLSGGFGGLYAGLGLDKSMLIPNSDLVLAGALYLMAGLDYHHYSITDSVGGTFAGLNPSTNMFSSSDTVPTVRIGGDLSVGKGGFQAGLGGSVNWGIHPGLEVIRPISNIHTTPYVDVSQLMSAEVHASVRLRF